MGKKNDLYIDSVLVEIVDFVIFPLSYLFKDKDSKYRYQKIFFKDDDLCYCNSGIEYGKCCKTVDKAKNRKAIHITKTNVKTKKTKVKQGFVNTKNYTNIKFRRGTINPLHKRGNYIITNIEGNYGEGN